MYMSSAFLESAESLKLVGKLIAEFPLSIDFDRVTFHNVNDLITPQNAFIAAGELNLSNIEFPVHFDKGAIRVVDYAGNQLLDVAGLSKQVVVQIGQGESATGMWLRTTDASYDLNIQNLGFSEDDVAFVDHSGVMLTINSKSPTLARVFYPDVKTWFDTLSAYRFWILSMAWLLLTLVVIYLYQKSRQHDKTEVLSSGPDDS